MILIPLGKKMEEKKSKLTSKITGKSCINTTQFFIQDIHYMHLGDVFFFTMNQFDWPITQKNETMEAPQDRRFSNYFEVLSSSPLAHLYG
jgi:hypothetical protein